MKGAVSKDSTATQKDHRLVVFVFKKREKKTREASPIYQSLGSLRN